MSQTTFIEQASSTKMGDAGSDGSYPIVLITPGQGTSGYYHEEIIRDYAPGAFPKGTHVYLDHLKEGENRTPAKLLGTLVEETTVNDEGEAINRFKPLSKHAQWVEEVKPYVGFSVAVAGEGRRGEVNGRQTIIVESLTPSITNTVDMVSYAGRGGRFLESYLEEANSLEEGERNQPDPQGGSRKENETMAISEEALTALTESVAALVAKLTEQTPEPEPKGADEVAADRFAAIEAVRAVEAADISDKAKARLLEGIKAGEYDVAAFIEEAETERKELREALEVQFNEEIGASSIRLTESQGEPLVVKGW
jgi:hypothetical protein